MVDSVRDSSWQSANESNYMRTSTWRRSMSDTSSESSYESGSTSSSASTNEDDCSSDNYILDGARYVCDGVSKDGRAVY